MPSSWVCLSVTLRQCIKMAKHRITQIMPQKTRKIMAKFKRGHPIRGWQMQAGWVEIGQITAYNSKTVQDRRIVWPARQTCRKGYIFLWVNFFFFSLFFYYEQSYLSIYWTDFNDLFTKWKVFAWIFLIRSSFSDSSRDVAMATNFVAKLWQNYLPPALIAVILKRNGISPCEYAHL